METKKGDRIIQIILLLIIAAGFAGIALILKGSGADSGQKGGMPGGPGAGGAPTAQQQSSDGSGESSTVAVEAEYAARQTVSQFIRVNGDVVSDVSVDIYPDVAGKIVVRNVDPGNFVKKGDVVAIVDPSVPGEFYSRSPILSTISGTIIDVNVNVGDTVSTSTSVAVVGDLTKLSLVTYVPERYITYLKLGLHAEVFLEAFPDTVFDARVVQLNPVVDNESRSMEVKLEIVNQDSRIRAGMFASMKLITRESRDCIAVPSGAVSSYYDDSVVYVVKDDNSVERRVVSLGLKSDEMVEVLSGLSENELVVTQGVSSVTDGSPVRMVNDPDAVEE
ncbi:efflux RND transporter periplasmic adaptor subunit [Sediminispirochaeta smaragdinae]|uniref:Efflux transporter, RND family, MFP subunit n=1 Tax=Sediminispirochaeta smaragdinae (strain DSM 11293 / JCM 15392 / SEBR 4228) TaxID=573413 RepID=E1RCF3_SEDSS|nr:efflux RND transporter periplasmic adaptor subunit [Sediminispirochaeta smaragdinae]ADK80033.1 efflux transporter, RND family, MFP subunit [Sediminispirochaeta smaragdinae DSM 11293]